MRLSQITTEYVNEEELLKTEFFQRLINEDKQVQNWRGPFTAQQLIDRFLLSDTTEIYENEDKGRPTFMWTNLANESIDSLNGKKEQNQIMRRLDDFVRTKSDNPLAKFGKSDAAFSKDSSLKGYKHAHLTYDYSIVYKYDGQKNQFCIYGVFNHHDLGTSTGKSNYRRQDSMLAKFKNQAC